MSQPSDEKKTQWIYARIHNDLASLETLLPDFDHVKTFAFEIYTCLCAAPYNDDVLPFFLKRWVLGQHEDDQKIITSAFINKNTIVLDYIRAHLDEILEFEKTLPDTQRHSNFQMIMESGEHWATKAMLPLLSDEQLCSAILSSHRFSSKPNRAYETIAVMDDALFERISKVLPGHASNGPEVLSKGEALRLSQKHNTESQTPKRTTL